MDNYKTSFPNTDQNLFLKTMTISHDIILGFLKHSLPLDFFRLVEAIGDIALFERIWDRRPWQIGGFWALLLKFFQDVSRVLTSGYPLSLPKTLFSNNFTLKNAIDGSTIMCTHYMSGPAEKEFTMTEIEIVFDRFNGSKL
jgi:hypothetical protein